MENTKQVGLACLLDSNDAMMMAMRMLMMMLRWTMKISLIRWG